MSRCTYLFISFAVHKWKTGKWSKCRLHYRQIQQYCLASFSSSPAAATTDNSLLAEHEKLNPNPLLIGYKVRNVYCTSTSISKAQQQEEAFGRKSQEDGDIDKTFYINQAEDKGENDKMISVSSKREKFGEMRQYTMSDPILTSSSVTSNKFCDKLIRPHSRTVCTTYCSYSRNTPSRYRLSSRDIEDTISQTRNNVVEINARVMNLCHGFEWSEWSKCNLLQRRGDSNYINYRPNDTFPDTTDGNAKCDKKVAGVQYRKRQYKLNLETNPSLFLLNQKCLSEYEEKTCTMSMCNNRKHKNKNKGYKKSDDITYLKSIKRDHQKRSSNNKNSAVWSRPQLVLTKNNFGQKNQRNTKNEIQRKRKKNMSNAYSTPELHSSQSHQTILSVPVLPEPQRLTTTFTPFLHVGPWGSCKNENNINNKRPLNQYENKRSFNMTSEKAVSNKNNHIFRNIMNKKHKRRRKGEDSEQQRGKREDGLFIGLNKKLNSKTSSWIPELPSDIEISFVATSVPEPQTGNQRRTVECRGQDGERLPFR